MEDFYAAILKKSKQITLPCQFKWKINPLPVWQWHPNLGMLFRKDHISVLVKKMIF